MDNNKPTCPLYLDDNIIAINWKGGSDGELCCRGWGISRALYSVKEFKESMSTSKNLYHSIYLLAIGFGSTSQMFDRSKVQNFCCFT